MDYKVRIKDTEYELPGYSLKIAERLEEIELLNQGNQKFREKCKKMYDFVSDTVGKQNIVDELGKLDDVDPNELNIAYLEIVKVYNKPLVEYNNDRVSESFDSDAMEKALKIIDSAPKLAEFTKKK